MALLAVILVGKSHGALRSGSEAISRKGVWVCVISGLLMGIFAPFVTKAMGSGHTLTPYTTAVFLTLGAFVCCFVFNPILMRKPLVGAPVSFAGYATAPVRLSRAGFAGRVDMGAPVRCSILWRRTRLACRISYAIGHSSPMIATAWGVFVWGEFSRSEPEGEALSGGYVCRVFAGVGVDCQGVRRLKI